MPKKLIYPLIALMSVLVASVMTPATGAGAADSLEFVGIDRDTGDRCTIDRTYGSYAYALPLSGGDERPIGGNTPEQPALASLDETGGPGFDGPAPNVTYDVRSHATAENDRALEDLAETVRRPVAIFGNSESVTLTVAPGSYRVAAYVLDWDSNLRTQDITVSTSTGSDSATSSLFVQGLYELFDVETTDGDITVQIDGISPNAVLSGLFVDPIGPVSGVSHAGQDTATGGDWVGAYGSTGYVLFGFDSPGGLQAANQAHDVSSGLTYSTTAPTFSWLAPFAQGIYEGAAYAFGWTGWLDGPTGDPRAQQFFKYHPELAGPPVVGDRLASTWDAGNELSVNSDDADRPLIVDISVPATHAQYDLALYFLDWDAALRSQEVTVTDVGGATVIDGPRLYSDFEGGVYGLYRIPGGTDIEINVERITGINAVLGGWFLDPAASAGPNGFLGLDTTTGSAADPSCTYGNYAYVLANADGSFEYPIGGNEASAPAVEDFDETGGPGFDAIGGPFVNYAVHGPIDTPDATPLELPDESLRRAVMLFGGAVTVDVVVPVGFWKLSTYSLDFDRPGRLITNSVKLGAGGPGAEASNEVDHHFFGAYDTFAIRSDGVTPFTVTVALRGGPNADLSGLFLDPLVSDPGFDVSHVGTDLTTGGDWVGNYGDSGHVLFGFNQPGANFAVHGPNPAHDVAAGFTSYTVTSGQIWSFHDAYDTTPVTQNAYAFAWNDFEPFDVGDPRGLRFWKYNELLDGPPTLGDRRAATWDSGDEIRGRRSLIIDLEVPANTFGSCFQLALRVVDFDSFTRVQEFRIYDADTDTLLDTQLISDFHDGAYLVWKVPASTNLRIETDALDGVNAVTGGLFLDEVDS